MTYDNHLYHADREQQCRDLAARCADPEVRLRHIELAELHAERAAFYALPPVAHMASTAAAQ